MYNGTYGEMLSVGIERRGLVPLSTKPPFERNLYGTYSDGVDHSKNLRVIKPVEAD